MINRQICAPRVMNPLPQLFLLQIFWRSLHKSYRSMKKVLFQILCSQVSPENLFSIFHNQRQSRRLQMKPSPMKRAPQLLYLFKILEQILTTARKSGPQIKVLSTFLTRRQSSSKTQWVESLAFHWIYVTHGL